MKRERERENGTLESDDALQLAQLLLQLAGDDEEGLQEGRAQKRDALLFARERSAIKRPLEAVEVDLGRELEREPAIGLCVASPKRVHTHQSACLSPLTHS
jgi:hypothetical protein